MPVGCVWAGGGGCAGRYGPQNKPQKHARETGRRHAHADEGVIVLLSSVLAGGRGGGTDLKPTESTRPEAARRRPHTPWGNFPRRPIEHWTSRFTNSKIVGTQGGGEGEREGKGE